MQKFTFLAGCLAVMLTAGTEAQEPPKPGPEHDRLKELVGTWDATADFMGNVSKGVMTYEMGLGGLWLFEHYKGEFGGMKFEGRGATTYNPQKKKYINVWVDSMVTTPMVSEGILDKNGHMVLKGKMPTPDGKTTDVTMTSERKDADNRVFTITTPGPEGKAVKMMTITYKRKQK